MEAGVVDNAPLARKHESLMLRHVGPSPSAPDSRLGMEVGAAASCVREVANHRCCSLARTFSALFRRAGIPLGSVLPVILRMIV